MKPKILLVAPSKGMYCNSEYHLGFKIQFHTSYHYLKEAFKKLGYRVYTFDYRQYYQDFGIRKMNEIFRHRTERLSPEIVLTIKGDGIFSQVYQYLQKKLPTTKFGLWYFDAVLEKNSHQKVIPPRNMLPIIRQQDIFFCICKDWLETIPNAYFLLQASPGTDFLPHKNDVTLTPFEKKLYSSDVVFVGTDNYEYRGEVLAYLKQNNINLKIFGNQINNIWDKYHLTNNWLGNKDLVFTNISNKNYSKLLKAVPISIGFSNCPNYDFDTCFSMRVFMVLGAGGFLLEQKSKNIETIFKPGKHLDTWSNKEELLEKIHYYLDNPTEREAIAQEGFKECLRKHQFTHRILEMMEIFRGIKK